MNINQLIAELQKVEDKTKEVYIGVQDAYWTGNYNKFKSNITVNDGWCDGQVILHVDNSDVSFIDPNDIRFLQDVRGHIRKLQSAVSQISESAESIIKDIDTIC